MTTLTLKYRKHPRVLKKEAHRKNIYKKIMKYQGGVKLDCFGIEVI